MNRNMVEENSFRCLVSLISKVETEVELEALFKELLTEAEIETLSKRWRILNLLKCGCTQREIAKEMQVSLCKVTRGAKILKDTNSVLAKLIKENDNE